MKSHGIARKTFLFTAVLITVILVLSFGLLYAILPGYYITVKSRDLGNNTEELLARLRETADEALCAQLISDFAQNNNADLLSFDKDDQPLPALSSAFMPLGQNVTYTFRTQAKDESDDRLIPAPSDSVTQSVIIVGEAVRANIIAPQEKGADALLKTMAFHRSTGAFFTAMRMNVQNGLIEHVTITSTMQPIGEAMGVMLSLLPFVLLLGILLALAASYVYARQLTKPILQISQAAERMKSRAPEAVSGLRSHDELGLLSRNLDALYGSLCDNIEELKAEMDKVSRLEQSKTDFLRAAGHELKTPAAALYGMLEGMRDRVGVYKDRDRYVEECLRQVDKLSGLITGILDASKADTALDEIWLEPLELGELAELALDSCAPLITQKALRVTKEGFPFTCMSDRNMLHAVWHNLIANAVRYTGQNGAIRLSCQRTADGCMAVSVENECPPIDEALLPRLFEAFYTLNESRDEAGSGTGLGLSIVARNLKALSIPFSLTNTETGVRFTMCLPEDNDS